jgi:hypothetical protein
MTRFACTIITSIFAEADRLLGRAMHRFWMAKLREQLQRENAVLR